MKTKNRITATVLAGGLALALTAGTAQAGPGGSYVQLGYADWDDLDDGFAYSASLSTGLPLRLFVDYVDVDNGANVTWFRAGGGWEFSITPMVGLELGLSYHELDFDTDSDDGFGVHGNVRVKPIPPVTLSARLEQVFFDDFEDETILALDVGYNFIPMVGAYLSYTTFDEGDNDLIQLGARISF